MANIETKNISTINAEAIGEVVEVFTLEPEIQPAESKEMRFIAMQEELMGALFRERNKKGIGALAGVSRV